MQQQVAAESVKRVLEMKTISQTAFQKQSGAFSRILPIQLNALGNRKKTYAMKVPDKRPPMSPQIHEKIEELVRLMHICLIIICY